MEDRLRARLEDLLLGASIGLSIILVFVVPLFVLDYNHCTASSEETELRTLLFYVTVTVAVIADLLLCATWRVWGSKKMMYSFLVVLVGLATLLLLVVLYFSSVCSMP